MKQVELIRQRVVRGQANELIRLRSFLSTTEGNGEAVGKLEGENGRQALAELTEFIMALLGHETESTAADTTRRSPGRRGAAKAMGALRGA